MFTRRRSSMVSRPWGGGTSPVADPVSRGSLSGPTDAARLLVSHAYPPAAASSWPVLIASPVNSATMRPLDIT